MEKYPRARAAARRVLHDFGVTQPAHIDVEAIARGLGAEIVYGPLIGATARIMRLGEVVRIRVSDRITHPGVKEFSLAHELGHLVLGHELPTAAESMDPTSYVARACRRVPMNGVDPEREADAFAAELLMPELLLRKRCEVSPVSLEPVRAIARDFRTSMGASAIRFAELTSERCAAVYSERGVVSWAVPSPTFTAMITRGVPLDRGSLAHDYFRKGTIDDAPQEVPAEAWLDGARDVEIVEHSQGLPDLGGVITLLWVPEAVSARLGMFE